MIWSFSILFFSLLLIISIAVFRNRNSLPNFGLTLLATIRLNAKEHIAISEIQRGEILINGVFSDKTDVREILDLNILELYQKFSHTPAPKLLIEAYARGKQQQDLYDLDWRDNASKANNSNTVVPLKPTLAANQLFKHGRGKVLAIAKTKRGGFTYRLDRHSRSFFYQKNQRPIIETIEVSAGHFAWAIINNPCNDCEFQSVITNNTAEGYHYLGSANLQVSN